MANLLESMGQCLWFDVERISRRNLVAVILAGLLVNILYNRYIYFCYNQYLCFVVFLWLVGSYL